MGTVVSTVYESIINVFYRQDADSLPLTLSTLDFDNSFDDDAVVIED